MVIANPGLNFYELTKLAQEELTSASWSVGKIQYSVNHLERAGKVRTERVIVKGRANRRVYPGP